MSTRPSFMTMWGQFMVIHGDGSVASVGQRIGGKVQQNIALGEKDPALGFKNACAIRMSYSLNHSGINISRGSWKTVSGADSRQYIYRVTDLMKFLTHAFGNPDRSFRSPKPADFAGLKGILVFNVQGWGNASGHATLWDGSTCSDHCYFPNANEAFLWQLR